ncbi:MAG: hypothetical protein HYU66_11230 [Armatimonadetes bacterium]|nr:hypothetical protein [Armatimonadota bacterium]
MRLAGAAIAVLSAAALAVPLPPDWDPSDSAFQATESHTTKLVEEGDRKGWSEHVDSVRFGAYGFSVTQRLDPEHGQPEQARQVWGDAFVGIAGMKPAFYMSSNWSPWDFLSAAVRLEGDAAEVPQPTRRARLACLGLREVTNRRVVAEADWVDAAGGLLRARFVVWRGVDRFGLVLRYAPPQGRNVVKLQYVLVCQPYDYSDRGYWERRRCLTTAGRSVELPERQDVTVDLAAEPQLVLHNRYAQSDSGTFLGLDAGCLAGVTVRGEGATAQVSLTPKSPATPVALVLGDWVNEGWALAAGRFFAARPAVADELAKLSTLELPPPAPAESPDDAEVDALVQRHPELAQQLGNELATARAELAAAWQAWRQAGADPPPALLVTLETRRTARDEVYRRLREAWVKAKLWGG